MPGGDQVQQVGLPGGEPGDGVAAPLGVQIGLVQVRAQQREQRPVPLGEIRPGLAEEEHPDGPPGPGGLPRRIGQAQLELVLDLQWPVDIEINAKTGGSLCALGGSLRLILLRGQ